MQTLRFKDSFPAFPLKGIFSITKANIFCRRFIQWLDINRYQSRFSGGAFAQFRMEFTNDVLDLNNKKKSSQFFSFFSSFSWKRGYSRWSKYPAQPEKVLLYHKENQLLYSLNLLWELHSVCGSSAKTIESSCYFLVFTCFNIFGFNSIIANEQDCGKTCQRGWYFTALRWRYMDGTSLKCFTFKPIRLLE